MPRGCVCASIQFKLNRPRLACCHSENRCRRHAINLNLMLNMLKRCKQFVGYAENERSHIYINFACRRPCNALSLVGAFVQWVCKMEGTSRDVWGFRAVLILAEMLISVLSYLQIHWVFNFISVVESALAAENDILICHWTFIFKLERLVMSFGII